MPLPLARKCVGKKGARSALFVCAMPRVVLSAIPFSEPINQTQLAPATPTTTPPTPTSNAHTPTPTPTPTPSSSSSSPSSPSSPSTSPLPPRPFAFCQHRWELQLIVKKNNALYRRCLERLAIARLDCCAIAPARITRTQSAPTLLPSSLRAFPGGSTSRVAGAG